MDQHSGYLVPVRSIQLDEAGNPKSWIQVFPIGHWDHPSYGPIDVDIERATRFVENIRNGVRGQQLNVDYDHNEGPAAGWYTGNAEVRADGAWAEVEWTPKAAKHLKDGEYKYFSPDFADEWQHPSTGKKYQDVLFGGGLTNRPHLKGILPINLSEVIESGNKPPTPAPPKEGSTVKYTEEQRKQLTERLGLAANATDEDIDKKLVENALAAQPPAPPAPSTPPAESDLVKKLKEAAPELATVFEGMQKQLNEQAVELSTARAANEVNRLETLAREKGYTIPPASRKVLEEQLAIQPVQLRESSLKFAEELLGAKLVQLGEKPGGSPTGEREREQTGAVEKVSKKLKEYQDAMGDKYTLREGLTKLSIEEPELFAEYRNASYSDNREAVN